MSVEEVVRPRVRVEQVTDGDTYYVLCNWRRDRTPPWAHASIIRVRLRDYSAREGYDRAAEDPRGLGRVDGPTAKRIAADVLSAAQVILVEHQGIDDRGRDVCWMWIDGESLGEKLLARHAVARISVMGEPA